MKIKPIELSPELKAWIEYCKYMKEEMRKVLMVCDTNTKKDKPKISIHFGDLCKRSKKLLSEE